MAWRLFGTISVVFFIITLVLYLPVLYLNNSESYKNKHNSKKIVQLVQICCDCSLYDIHHNRKHPVHNQGVFIWVYYFCNGVSVLVSTSVPALVIPNLLFKRLARIYAEPDSTGNY